MNVFNGISKNENLVRACARRQHDVLVIDENVQFIQSIRIPYGTNNNRYLRKERKDM